MNQLAIFEPSGAELATLAASTLNQAYALEKQAQLLELRGFLSAAHAYSEKAFSCMENAFVFELAAQFEFEAGLI